MQNHGLKAEGKSDLESQIQIIRDIIQVYSETIGYFRLNAKFKLSPIGRVDHYEKAKSVSNRMINYIVMHPEHLMHTSISTGIRVHKQNFIPSKTLVEENVIGSVKEQIRDYDLLSVVMLCLGGDKGENYDGVLKLLDVLLSSEKNAVEKKQVLQDNFHIPMTQELESEVEPMCNLSRDVLENGIEQGIEKGMKKGMEKGKVERILSAIRSLMLSMGWTAEQAIEALQISETDRSHYVTLL